MVAYMDSKISALINIVSEQGLKNNTFFFVVGDNGSPTPIESKYKGRLITGAKGTTNEFGLHVSLIVTGPSVQPNSINRNIIDFTDFMPTIADMASIPKSELSQYGIMDGTSFYNQLFGAGSTARTYSYGYYFPEANMPAQKRVYVQDTVYKLYDATNHNYFFNLQKDSLEQNPLANNKLTIHELGVKRKFANILSRMHN